MQKKSCYGSEVIHFLCVCASVCPSSQQKSAITFDPLHGPAQNFQGPLNSSQVIFGWVTRTLGPPVRPGPRKKGFLPNLSPPWVLEQGAHVIPFRKWKENANKMLGAEFWFLAHGLRKGGPEGGAGRGATKFLEFQLVLYKGPPLKSCIGCFWFYITF